MPRYVSGIAKVGSNGAAEVRITHRAFAAFVSFRVER